MNKLTKKILFLILLLLISICFYSCKEWEYDIEKNGIHFKKMYQSKGGTNTGYMTENHNIQGFPCEKGWIHFRKNWEQLILRYIDKSLIFYIGTHREYDYFSFRVLSNRHLFFQ